MIQEARAQDAVGVATEEALSSRQAEASVIGAVFLAPRSLDAVRHLRAHDFAGDPAHPLIWRAILDLDAEGGAPDPVTVSERLRDRGDLERAGGLEYLVDLPDVVPTADNIQHHARIVADKARRRDALRKIELLDRSVRNPDFDMEQVEGDLARHAAEVVELARNGKGETSTWSRVPPLFRLEDNSFARFLGAEPPPRQFLLKGLLPLGVAAALASPGGVGKSTLLYQLLISVATGIDFVGIPVESPGSAVLISAEDDGPELHRRGARILRHYQQLGHVDADALGRRLFVVPRVGVDNLLTRTGPNGEVTRTPMVARLIEALRAVPDLRLVVLDPVSRFRGGNANTEEDATRFVEVLEAIREATGATVLGVWHVNKLAVREGGGQDSLRGSSATVDGLRWVATMERLPVQKASRHGVPQDQAHRYIRFKVDKNNYAPPFADIWLEQQEGGLLVPTDLRDADEEERAKAQGTYVRTMGRVQDYLRQRGPKTRRNLRDLAGTAGIFGVGDHNLRAMLDRGVNEGDLVEVRDGSHLTLHPPPREVEP